MGSVAGKLCLAPADELTMPLLFAEGTSMYVSAILPLTFSLVKGKTETGRAWSGASGSIFRKGLGRDR